MGKMSSKESAIPWGWALEALVSSEEVAVTVLHDLIEKVVPHLPDDLRNSVNERVALRCLDDLFGPHDASPTQRSKLSLDFSESCRAVLKRIVNETPEFDASMGGGGKWKWDIHPFIQHKRASMPKLALQKLKESIVDGTHPYADLLRRNSGLTSSRVPVSDSNVRFNGSCSNAPEEERNDESALPSKRGRIAADNTEKMVDENHSHDSDRNAKKSKIDASGVLGGREMLEDSSEGYVPVSEGERCVSACGMGMMERSCALAEDRCDDNSKDDSGFNPEPTISGVAPPHETQHKVSAKDSSCNSEHEFHIQVPHPISVVGSKQKSIADGSKDDSEHCPEPSTSHVAPPEHMVFAQESDCNTEHDSHINITRPASADVSKKKTIADETKDLCQLDYVATEKRDFLSSKCSLNRYSHSKEKDHCLMCNEGGQLLICSTIDCPLVYHESCMGSNFISYEKGNFYCPFCAYSLDLTEYLETEKEASRLRKDLHSFSCLLSKSSERTFGREIQGNQGKIFENEVNDFPFQNMGRSNKQLLTKEQLQLVDHTLSL